MARRTKDPIRSELIRYLVTELAMVVEDLTATPGPKDEKNKRVVAAKARADVLQDVKEIMDRTEAEAGKKGTIEHLGRILDRDGAEAGKQ